MTLDDVSEIVRGWIFDKLAIETNFAFPDAPRPVADPFCEVNHLGSFDLSKKESREVLNADFTTTVTVSKLQRADFSINIYRASALANVETLINSLDDPLIIDYFNDNNVGIGEHSDARNMPDVVKLIWEERGQFDISFYFRSEYVQTIETIRKIEVTNEISGDTFLIEKT